MTVLESLSSWSHNFSEKQHRSLQDAAKSAAQPTPRLKDAGQTARERPVKSAEEAYLGALLAGLQNSLPREAFLEDELELKREQWEDEFETAAASTIPYMDSPRKDELGAAERPKTARPLQCRRWTLRGRPRKWSLRLLSFL